MTKILVVEDETILREAVMDWLIFEGYEVLGAADGVEGVDTASQSLPDLIICDITMPRLDGYGVLLELRSARATSNIPFIFVTAKAAHEDVRLGMNLGADDYITKPFTRLELLQAIQSRLAKKVFQDQDKQNKVDQLQQALVEEHEQRLLKSKLVAMFSHDFRNQLTVILSGVMLVRDYADRLGEKRRLEHLNSIEASSRLLLQMLDDMLIVAQMETGNLILQTEPLKVEQYLYGIVQEFQETAGESHRLHFESNFADTILGDSRVLRQIAANLISNAIKYSPSGKDVHVTLNSHDEQYVFVVQDEGVGIPDADRERLFSAFQRGSNVGKIAGTGLGLAIVKQAVDLLGGSIHVESRVDVGTTITVALPFVPAPH